MLHAEQATLKAAGHGPANATSAESRGAKATKRRPGTVGTGQPIVRERRSDDRATQVGLRLPLHRIERLERGLAIPMPVGTQWVVVPVMRANTLPKCSLYGQ